MKNVWPNYDIAPYRLENRTYIRQCDKPLARLDLEEYYESILSGIRLDPSSNYSIALCNLAYDNNIGNCIRSADAFGVKNVYLLGSKQFNKKVSVGSYALENIYHVPTIEGWKQVISKYDRIIAVDNNNSFPKEKTVSLPEYNIERGTLFVFGNEGFGIPETFLNDCSLQVFIPMSGRTRSVNVASACSIILYQAMLSNSNEKESSKSIL